MGKLPEKVERAKEDSWMRESLRRSSRAKISNNPWQKCESRKLPGRLELRKGWFCGIFVQILCMLKKVGRSVWRSFGEKIMKRPLPRGPEKLGAREPCWRCGQSCAAGRPLSMRVFFISHFLPQCFHRFSLRVFSVFSDFRKMFCFRIFLQFVRGPRWKRFGVDTAHSFFRCKCFDV